MANPEHGSFATLIGCIDGRTQLPAISFTKGKFNVDFVDNVTAAGADQNVSFARAGVEISVKKHGSNGIVVAGHFDCAGNPVSDGQHFMDIRRSVEVVRSWGLEVPVVGAWVNKDWQVEEI